MNQIGNTITLKDGSKARILARQEFEGYELYTVDVNGVTRDVEASEVVAPPLSDRDRWTILLSVMIIGGGLFMLLVRVLLTGA